MAVTPQTEIRLLNVPFEIDNKNQLTFSNLEEQTNYFTNLPYLEIENAGYQRKDNIIRFNEHIDKILNYNYVMYKNENYSDKWFYAFITNMEYDNDKLTNISIETDVFQTWQFDIIYKKMFVEREHVSNDTIGINTIDENLNVGEVIEEDIENVYDLGEEFYYIILSSYNPISTFEFDGVNQINGNLFGTYVFAFGTTNVDIVSMRHFIEKTNKDGKIEDILAICVAPKILIDDIGKEKIEGTYDGATYSCYIVKPDSETKRESVEVPVVTPFIRSFKDFKPKNNKCYVYPYNYMLITNNIGTKNILKYEDFNQSYDYVTFDLQVSFSIGCSGRLVPREYKNIDYNIDEAIALAKYPTCAWSGDAFTNWLTENSVNIVAGFGSLVGNIGLSVASGGVTSPLLLSSALNIASQIGQFYQASLLPNIQGGQATGDVNFSSKNNGFVIHKMRAKTEYLKIIDDFFSMYGYKVNSVKIPNITGRKNWNYVKTIECNITGEIPQNDIQKLKDIFNNGVTFWHSPNTFLDYSQENNII